jgi:hypothetical protein
MPNLRMMYICLSSITFYSYTLTQEPKSPRPARVTDALHDDAYTSGLGAEEGFFSGKIPVLV